MKRKILIKKNKENGFVLIAVIFVIMGIVLSLVSYLYGQTEKSYDNLDNSERERSKLMSKIKKELERFYIANSEQLTSGDISGFTNEYILGNLELPSRTSTQIQVRISNIKENDLLRWRDIYAWIPSSDGIDNTAFNPNGDVSNAITIDPTDDVKWTVYSGINYESQKLKSSTEQLNDIGRSIQRMALGNINEDFFRDSTINYFANCEPVYDTSTNNTIPRPSYTENYPSIECAPAGDFGELASLNAPESLGLPASMFNNNWSNPIYIANHSNSDAAGNPLPTSIAINGENINYNSITVPFSFILLSETSKPNTYIYTVVNQLL